MEARTIFSAFMRGSPWWIRDLLRSADARSIGPGLAVRNGVEAMQGRFASWSQEWPARRISSFEGKFGSNAFRADSTPATGSFVESSRPS